MGPGTLAAKSPKKVEGDQVHEEDLDVSEQTV
jgi:hypothetical protein